MFLIQTPCDAVRLYKKIVKFPFSCLHKPNKVLQICNCLKQSRCEKSEVQQTMRGSLLLGLTTEQISGQ